MKAAMVVACEAGIQPLGLAGDFAANIQLLADLGYDGAELSVMNIDRIDTREIGKIARRHGLAIPAVASGRYFAQHGLSLSSSNREVRSKTVAYVKESLKYTAELDSNFLVGSAQGEDEGNRQEAFRCLKDSLGQCARVAEGLGILILLEPVNRYMKLAIRNFAEGMAMIDQLSSPAVRMVADTHHMNIEERSNRESLIKAKGYTAHVHFSDSNRLAPGLGQVDYIEVAEALREIGYQGFVSAEILPEPDPLTAAKQMISLVRSLPY